MSVADLRKELFLTVEETAKLFRQDAPPVTVLQKWVNKRTGAVREMEVTIYPGNRWVHRNSGPKGFLHPAKRKFGRLVLFSARELERIAELDALAVELYNATGNAAVRALVRRAKP